MRRASLRADLTLLLVACIWGSGFVAQRHASAVMGAFTFNALRYTIGFALVAGLLTRARRLRPTREELIRGGVLGLIMTAAAWLQQAGVEHTTAARAGFFTGLYVLLVPLVGLTMGQRASLAHLFGAVLAALGLWRLSGDVSGGIGRGDLLVMGCAVLWAVHVALTGKLAPRADAMRLAGVQFALVAVCSAVLALVLERARFATAPQGLLPTLYSGVFPIGVAFTLQIVGQRHAPPAHAAVLMSMEAVFAAAFGVAMLGEHLRAAEMTGCALMFAGCVLPAVWPHRRARYEIDALKDPTR
ncbi:MAG: DMT family transporter [Phycisphaerales bacterium]|nr:DMT family transporter [Phycisphaerales bacterium]